MHNQPQFSKAGFLKSYLLPALVMFLIPGFGLWFFTHVESYHDREIRDSLVARIRADPAMSAEGRQKMAELYGQVSVSKILASEQPGNEELKTNFEPVRIRYAVFRWMKRTAAFCLLSGLAAFVAVGVSVLFSFRSQRAQYWSLRVGWTVLRGLALIQVVCQGVLTVALSFWVTAFWTEQYFIKLIFIAALLAGLGVFVLVLAIFSKVALENEFRGQRIPPEAAPLLWARVSEMAAKLGIAPPDHIFVGIDDNFFVTEHPVKVGGQRHEGRTLFASLSLLKTLSRAEADAVLAHELAHFSGEDTLYSRRISPLLGKYAQYLRALYHGVISRPVFYFMHFFWNLYQISLGKLSREREFRADRVGGEVTSPQDMGNALIKVAAYCRYRRQVQQSLFDREENVASMDVFARLENGFPSFAVACTQGGELAASGTPHPFDSHPPLAGRLGNLGVDAPSALASAIQLPVPADTWFPTIEGAAEMETSQWKSYEEMFHKAHEESLVWRFKPEGEAEIRHVLKHFPGAAFTTAKGLTATLDYEKVNVSDWEAPVPFASVTGCRLVDSLGTKRLYIDYREHGQGGKRTQEIRIQDFKGSEGGPAFLDEFQKYYGRNLAHRKYQEQKAKGKAGEKNSDA